MFVCRVIMSKNASSKKTSETNPRNTFVAAMMGRYGKTTTTMGDRRKSRGGQRNRQRDYMSGDYLLYNDTEEEEDQMTIIDLCIEVLRGPWSSDQKYRANQIAVQKLLLECTY